MLSFKDRRERTDQFQASLAGEDDCGGVVLGRICFALGRAVVRDGHLACCTSDLRTTGAPSDILKERELIRTAAVTEGEEIHGWSSDLTNQQPAG